MVARIFFDKCCPEAKEYWIIRTCDGCLNTRWVHLNKYCPEVKEVWTIWSCDGCLNTRQEYSWTIAVQKSKKYESSEQVVVVWIPDKSILRKLLSRSQGSMNYVNIWWLSKYHTRVILDSCCQEIKELWYIWTFNGFLNTRQEYSWTIIVQRSRKYELSEHLMVVLIPDKSIHW